LEELFLHFTPLGHRRDPASVLSRRKMRLHLDIQIAHHPLKELWLIRGVIGYWLKRRIWEAICRKAACNWS